MNPLSMISGFMGGGASGALGGMGGGAGLMGTAMGSMKGWENVAASSFAMKQGVAQNKALADAKQDSMMQQSLITLVTDIIEGACKMVKGAGEAIKGLC